MGFLQKLKEFFQPEEHGEEQGGGVVEEVEPPGELKIEDIDSHLDKKHSEVERDFLQKESIFRNELSNILDKLKEDVRVLEGLDLSERKVDDRLRQIVESGRRDYVSVLYKFIKDLKEIELGKVNLEVNRFVQATAKSHFKTTQIIGKEVEEIVGDIRQIQKLEGDFLSNNKSLIEKRREIASLLGKNKERKNKEKEKLKLDESIGDIQEAYGEKEKILGGIQRKIQETKDSSQYKEREKLLAEKEKKEKSVSEIKLRIGSLVEKKILGKYAYLEEDKEKIKYIQAYIKDPAKTLLSDTDLKIMKILEDVRDKIKENKISVKNPSKAIEGVTIENEVFLEFKDTLLGLNKDIGILDDKISKIRIDLDEIPSERSGIENKIAEDKKQIEVLTKRRDRFDEEISKLSSELRSKG